MFLGYFESQKDLLRHADRLIFWENIATKKLCQDFPWNVGKNKIIKLSTPEKILLVEDLRDSIVSDESAVPVPQSHMEELDRRLKRYGSPPGTLLSLEELRARIEKRK